MNKILIFFLSFFLFAGHLAEQYRRYTNQVAKKELQVLISKNKALSYKEARRYLFGELFLQKNSTITDIYCEKTFGPLEGVGPSKIPNANKINCEHSWPQSKFSTDFPADMQKGDLHHLFPTDNKANGLRGNLAYAEVVSDNGKLAADCSSSKLSLTGFEPPDAIKGDLARAHFYFAIRYQLSIDDKLEALLRKWHEQDPVDDAEMKRNRRIEEIQGNRNPFIDDPDLVDVIADF